MPTVTKKLSLSQPETDFQMPVELLTFSTILTGYFGSMVAQNPSGPLALFSAGDFCWL